MFKSFILVLSLLISSKLNAATIVLEPYAGYHFAKYDISTDPKEAGDVRGYGAGAKIGTVLNGVRVSAEGMYSKMEATPDNNEVYKDKDAEHTMYGLSLGLPLPGGIQLFGGYFMRSNFKLKKNDSDLTEDVEFKGRAYKAGVGLPLFMGSNLNIEVIRNDFKEVKTSSNGVQNIKDSSYNGADFESIFVSVSFPLTLTGSGK